MDRLTIECCGGYVPRGLCSIDRYGDADDCDLCFEYCKALEGGSVDCRGCAVSECFDRLGEYEDTGLAPGQVREMDRLYTEKCRELAEYQKYEALRRAVGREAYIISRNPLKVTTGEVAFIRVSAQAISLRIYVAEYGRHINRAFEQVGKSVFFTRAAAEGKLAKIKGAGKADGR